jgi:hypothetical protein
MPRADEDDNAPSFARYLALVPEDDIVTALEAEPGATLALLQTVAKDEACVRHLTAIFCRKLSEVAASPAI